MKQNLLATLKEIADLLMLCGWKDKAVWFLERANVLFDLEIGTPEFEKELNILANVLVGMGSFSDLPLYPKGKDGVTADELRTKQWDLTEKLGRLIKELRKIGDGLS